jgi:hypothetical protein
MPVNSHAHRDSPDEAARTAEWLRKSGLTFPARPSATVIPLDHPAKNRQPLSFSIIDGPEDAAPERSGDTAGYLEAKRLIAEAVAGLPEAARNQPATIADVFAGLELPLSLIFDERDAASKGFKELRALITEIKTARREEAAEARAVIAELRSELLQMRSIQEAARIQSRGEEGREGPRGVPGSQGPAGAQGKQGPRGAIGPAAKPAAWEPNVEAFSLTPIYGDGERGVSANLRPFFEAYDAQTRGGDEEA